jgi:hypothetical protein
MTSTSRQRIAQTAQLALVPEVIDDIGVPGRDHVLEARIELEFRRLESQHGGDDEADEQHGAKADEIDRSAP